MNTISATIITLNEERNISECLASLDFVDEIVVVDSGSSDSTENLCRANPKVRFISHSWEGYGRQKNFAAGQAANDWILNVDADERVSSELRSSITTAAPDTASAFRMSRENYFGKRWIKNCGWYPDYTTRLYDRRKSAFSERTVHESLVCPEQAATLDGNLRHYTYDGIEDYLRRMVRYSRLAAEQLVNEGGRPRLSTLIVKPLATFVRMYFLRQGFREGEAGLTLSLLYAIYTFCKYSFAREMLNNK
jgi:glycosyltransferase involved in cell wall biosynthesis